MSDRDIPYWNFRQHPGTKGTGAITKWREKFKKYDEYAEIEFETVINNLSSIKNHQSWSDKDCRKMVGGWEDIYELRFSNKGGVPIRVFGFIRLEEREFVMLSGASHDQRKYDPSDIQKMTLTRRKEIVEGRELPIDFDFSFHEEEQNDDEYFKALLGIE